jgi:hypothetical protein
MAQLLTVPPYAVAAVVLTGSSYFSDRMQSRGLYMAIASVVGSIGYMYVSSNIDEGTFVLISSLTLKTPTHCLQQ